MMIEVLCKLIIKLLILHAVKQVIAGYLGTVGKVMEKYS